MTTRNDPDSLIPRHGGYRQLRSFTLAQLCYDVTVRFCNRYIDKRSRTHDQMVQAARSGVQNIAEGSQASGTSKKTELKLTNVARASLEELRIDYEDYLRHRKMMLWDVDDPRRMQLVARRCGTADDVADWVREQYLLAKQCWELDGRNGRNGLNGHDEYLEQQRLQDRYLEQQRLPGQQGQQITSGAQRPISSHSRLDTSMRSIESISSMTSNQQVTTSYAEIAANAALVLIGVACSLLDRQLKAQARAFTEEGGFTERLYRTRSSRRRQQ